MLTGANNTWNPSKYTGAGDHSGVKVGSYYYMYYNPTDPWGISVARASVSSGGKPGAWSKWSSGSFSQPALGGIETLLPNITGTYVHKVKNGGLMAVSNNRQPIAGTEGGVFISFSKDGINWKKHSTPLFALPTDAEVGYAAFADRDGNENLGNSTYLFYEKRMKADKTRYLMRRQVDFYTN